MLFSITDMERYQRQTMLSEIGHDGQLKLGNASVLVVGVGGLGSAAATYLAGAGVGHLGIADHDVVSLTNLQRQVLYDESQIGQCKVVAAARRLGMMNSDISINPVAESIRSDNAVGLISGYDLVLDCCDNFYTRYLIDDACAECGKPWVHGAIGEFAGQLTVFNHNSRYRYADLYPDRDWLCSLPRTTRGVVGAVAGVIGSMQACEAVKLICGFGSPLDGRMLTINCATMHTEILSLSK